MNEQRPPRPPRSARAAPAAETSEEPSEVRAQFDRLLSSPRYERLRERLIRLFARRNCEAPEELADETVARVVSRLPEICLDFRGRPERYVYGVARNVFREYARSPKPSSYDDRIAVPRDSADPGVERAHECLERCLGTLGPGERELIHAYYLYERSAKIDHRRSLAERLGLGLNALRIKAFRIRQRLYRCVTACLETLDSG